MASRIYNRVMMDGYEIIFARIKIIFWLGLFIFISGAFCVQVEPQTKENRYRREIAAMICAFLRGEEEAESVEKSIDWIKDCTNNIKSFSSPMSTYCLTYAKCVG